MTTQAVKDKGAEHSRHELLARRIVSYVVLAILCFLCLFFFYVLIINATRNHYQIQCCGAHSLSRRARFVSHLKIC